MIEFDGQNWVEIDGEQVLVNADGGRAAEDPKTDPGKLEERIKEMEQKLEKAEG